MLSVTLTTVFSGAMSSVARAESLPLIQEVLHGKELTFIRDRSVGAKGADVRILQQFLNTHGAQVSASGSGSPGNETTYFGEATRSALAQWQRAAGIAPAIGYFGPKSRAAMKTLAVATASLPTPASLFSPTNESIPLHALGAVAKEQAGQATAELMSGLPVRLKIPTINVDAAFEYVGLTQDGAMGVPKGPGEVAWFNLGPRPGAMGSAVIAGHWGWKNGIPAVFDNLSRLHKGDKISVEDDQGVITTFIVREMRTFGERADASDVFGSDDQKAHVNLITCEGIWNKTAKSYSNRLVVFADME